MSLTIDGIWAGGVWAPTVWADDVWYEPDAPPSGDNCLWASGVWASGVWADGVWYCNDAPPPVVEEETGTGAARQDDFRLAKRRNALTKRLKELREEEELILLLSLMADED